MTLNNPQRGRLGPHELKEAELMRLGQKEVAFFYADYPEEYLKEIRKNIENGSFESLQLEDNNGLIVWLPGAEQKALRLAELVRFGRQHGYVESAEREIGQILGYSEVDIDYYIEHVRSHFQATSITL
ncbi:hypothetical protein [Advenella mimigardefordensis]|uniref:Uncharacterized protein n=1 Tax=Advenella mimigardefordensis (strain DSM 17166 / LMG 22922 / DPN7) TaxID=1247726 RepID=W0PAR2_ADVMD|nr:hypothetical protein [Advenella mimigardefordensis]AHG63939.1 hypothetical protein MIM_c18590 [Advenella mimigardefordensis DPN7]